MENNYFKKCDYGDLEKNYREALKDDNFKKIVSKLNLSEDKLMKHTSSLEESVNELKNCAKCKSLAMCKNKVEGFVYYPVVEEEKLSFSYIACKYKETVFKEEATRCDFYDMPASIRSASMKNINLDDASRVKAIKALKKFYDTYEENPHQKGIYLNGSFGCGKTYLIAAMLNELAKKRVDIIVVYYPELLRKLKEAFDTDFSTQINKLKRVSILFLDDIGAEAVTPWARDEILGTILQYRMDSSLPTFFSSNLNLEELEVHLSSTKSGVEKVKARRIIERIKQLTTQIEMVGQNRRN